LIEWTGAGWNMSIDRYVAFDLGAESGRVLLGSLDGFRLELEEVHRFPNGAVQVRDSLRWDVLHLFEELKTGLRKVAARGVPVAGISTDSWGVDYVLLHGREPLLSVPFHYRDARTEGAMERAFRAVSADEIFAETGIQFMPINTLFQLCEDAHSRPGLLGMADKFLNIGDYFNCLFSGVCKAEESLASTTQLYNPRTRTWSARLIGKFGLPARIMPEVVASGTRLGPLLPAIAAETGLSGVQVIAGCSHDTAAAVAAVPARGEDWAYLSSGTWSLLGVETAEPIIGSESRRFNFTNEVGFGGSIRFLKNIIGLWIVQECRRAWARQGLEYSYEDLAMLAGAADPLQSFVDPQDARFGKPGAMHEKVAAYCRETHQPVPGTPGATIRCALESLALCYRQTLEKLEQAIGRKIARLHIVGGGSKNSLLNQFTADAAGIPVLAGPSECTGIGNVLVQAIALGRVPSLAAARQIVYRSFPPVTYEPGDPALWEQAYARFCRLQRMTPEGAS
jgi:rhamnulokinase